MTYNRLRRMPAGVALTGALLLLPLVMGCQPKTIVARVNDKPITESEYITKVQSLRQNAFQNQDPKMDAGSIAIVQMIQAELVNQCASDAPLKAEPSDDAVKAYFKQMLQKSPELANGIATGQQSEDELLKNVKTYMEMFAIGTDGAKPDDKEIQDQYDKLKASHQLDFPAAYTIRYLVLNDRAKAASVLEELKKSGSFISSAPLLGAQPEQIAAATKPTVVPGDRLPPAVLKVIDTLTPNQYTPEPIEVPQTARPGTAPNTPPASGYFIAQFISKVAGKTPTPGEIRQQLIINCLQEKLPQWQLHAAVRVAEYTEKAKIDILVPKYSGLVAQVIMPAARRNAATSAGEGGIPGGAPSGAPSAPSGANPGGAAAPPTHP